MRFLLVTDFYPPHHIGGDATHVRYLASLLRRKGHTVDVLVNGDATHCKGMGSIYTDMHVQNMRTCFPRAHAALAAFIGKGYKRMLQQLLAEKTYDVLHFHNIRLFGDNITHVPHPCKLVTLHDRKMLARAGKYKVNALICPSRAFASRCANRRKVFLPHFIPRVSRTRGEPCRNIICIGVLEQHKGIRDAVAACSQARMPLDIVGEGSLRAQLERLAIPCIHFLGRLSHAGALSCLAKARALVIASYEENCPVVAAEAMALGVPIVVRDIPVLRPLSPYRFATARGLARMLRYRDKWATDRRLPSESEYYRRYMQAINETTDRDCARTHS